MEEPKSALPALLPWAAAACLAALVACVGELLFIEKARTRLLQDENLLSQAALKSSENQLEAERILGRREREGYAADRGTDPESPVGAIALGPGGTTGLLWTSNMPGGHPDRDFQLWLLGEGPRYPAACGTFHAFPEGDSAVPIQLTAPVAPGCSFVLVYGTRGGERDFAQALSRGVIELATRPPAPKITR
jgi:hypothetical protein